MTMKLIMESWRQHINEIGMSQASLGLSDEEYEKAMKPASMRPLDELSAKEIYDIISFIDPTQITAYPEAALAIKNFTDKPNWFNAAIVTVSLLAIIPLFGKLAKAGKLSMLTKRADSISKKLKTSKDSNLTKKADEIEDAIVRVRKFRSKQTKSKPLEIMKKLKRDVLSTRKYIGSLPVGSTVTLKQDVYLFIQAKEGKFADGFVKPSMGMGSQDAEKVLEKIRKVSFPDAVPRQNSVYLTPFSDAKRWDHYGPDTYVVKVPKGSKISKMDADWATEVAHDLRSQYSDEVERAVETAAEYWKGAAQSWNYGASTEIITRAKVEVIGKVKDLNLGFSKFRTKTPINDPKWPIISTKRYQGQN